MLALIIVFLGLSLLLYLLLGGADFGAGILELFTRRKNQEQSRALTYRAMGPIWEANHMWLVLMVVILFVGFPQIFKTISVHLHLPLLGLLLGIMLRGTAFVFRHYDAIKDHTQRYYNAIFKYSSFITPMFLGIIAGAITSGKINPEAIGFKEAYLDPWLNGYAIAVGLFTSSICAFLAAVYLIGEAENDYDKKRFIRKAQVTNVTTVVAGGLVFGLGELQGVNLFSGLMGEPVSLVAIGLATVSLVFLWQSLRKGKFVRSRIMAGFQVLMILVAWGWVYFPGIVVLADGSKLDLIETAGPEGAQKALGLALIIGGAVILPALFYLFKTFGLFKGMQSEKK